MRQTYATDVIKEKVVGDPFLLEGEQKQFEAACGIPPTGLFACVFLTFIPPFILGVILYLLLRHQRKHNGIWVTDRRLVAFRKHPLTKYYSVTSIPLDEIRTIRRVPLGTFASSLIDRLLGTDGVQVFVRDTAWVQCTIPDVKSAGKLIKYVRGVIPEEPLADAEEPLADAQAAT